MIRTNHLKTRLRVIEGKRKTKAAIRHIETREMNERLSALAGYGGTVQGASKADTSNSIMLKAMRQGMPPDDAIRFTQRTIAALAAMDECNERE